MPRITRETAQALSEQYYGHRLKPSQADIMALCLDMTLPRVAILGATQIQKSRAAARAIGILAAAGGLGVTIVGPKEEQAITPLQYFIGMIDNMPYFQNKLLSGGEHKVERLKASESKSFLSFKGGGHIRAITLNERDSADKRKTNLGKGDQIVLFEEASLSSNETESMVLRMVAGWGYTGRIIKLGNAISREEDHNHFYRAVNGEDGYASITIDYHRALAEGIYTPEFIEEARKRPFFPQLYECIFPDPSQLLKGGYMRLFRIEDIILARAGDRPDTTLERPVIGIDIGQGKPDKTSIVARWKSYAEKIFESTNEDIMAQIGEYQSILKALRPWAVNVDATGIGNGVAPRLKELGIPAFSVIVGSTSEKEGYANIKAQAFQEAHDWMVNLGGKLGYGEWNQLQEVAFKVRSDKNMIIESKDELRARGVASYNDADAFMLTFANVGMIGTYATTKPGERGAGVTAGMDEMRY
jgi:hypothetical protein